MATETSQANLNAAEWQALPVPDHSMSFGGFSLAQIVIGALVLLALVWAMWTTREVLALRKHTVVSVRLGELVNQFALAEARSGDDPDKVTARTRAFMAALDRALKQRSANGAVVLVGEAVVSSSSEDITRAVAAEVAGSVPMPVAQALPPRIPVAPASAATGIAQNPFGQANPGTIGTASQTAPFASSGGQQGGAYKDGADAPAYQGGGDGQQ